MPRASFRVHLVTHEDGRCTGRLLPAAGRVDHPPSGYGHDDQQVLTQLALAIEEKPEDIPAYLWDAPVELRSVRVAVHPQAVVKRRHVIGKDEIGLQIAYDPRPASEPAPSEGI